MRDRAQEVRYKSQKQEKKVAKEVNGRTVIASGALWGSKGDVRNDDFLVECKTTSKDKYSLNYSTWEKIRNEALFDGFRKPAMCIDVQDGLKRIVVLDAHDSVDFIHWARSEGYTTPCRKTFSSKRSKAIYPVEDITLFTFVEKRVVGNIRKDIDLIFAPWDMFKEFLEFLEDVNRPTAHWIDNADSFICSNCGYETNNPNKEKCGSNTCPKCNAKME